MKLSRFNVYASLGGDSRTAIYNTWTGKNCFVQNSLAKFLSGFQEREGPVSSFMFGKEDFSRLVACGIIVPESRCQEAEFQFLHDKAKYEAKQLKFLIITTLACNLRCSYCYQDSVKKNDRIMSKKIAWNVIQFIANQIKHDTPEAIVTGIYGGEPLLNVEICGIIMNAVYKIAKTKGINLEVPLTTNGFYLADYFDTPAISLATSIHLTLDGDCMVHDAIRKTARGDGSYGRIMAGIRKAVKVGKKLIIRIHSNQLKSDHLLRILDDLHQAGFVSDENGQIYLMGIESCQLSKSKIECQQPSLEQKHIQNLLYAVSGHPLDTAIYKEFHLPSTPLSVQSLSCEYEMASVFTINYDGKLMLCPRVENSERTIGRIREDGATIWNPLYHKVLSSNQHNSRICSKCEFLPICGGPCMLKPQPRTLDDCKVKREVYRANIITCLRSQHATSSV